MASTRSYKDYLDNQVDIAPVNSQEELDAANLLQSLMDEHGLETQMQEFSAPAAGSLPHGILYLVLFVGVVLSGILGTAVGVVGGILGIVAFALLAAAFAGNDPLSRMGGTARSQNVIGVHRATGPLVVKGNRPIVIIAHYDTPNEGLLYRPPLARWRNTLLRSSFACVLVAGVCTVVQLLGFLPDVVRHVFWFVGIVAGLPLLALGVAAVHDAFAPCTVGANDNKASLAALLGVMDKVRPSDDEAKRWVEANPRPERLAGEEGAATDLASAEDLAGQPATEEEAAGEGNLPKEEPKGLAGLFARLRGGKKKYEVPRRGGSQGQAPLGQDLDQEDAQAEQGQAQEPPTDLFTPRVIPVPEDQSRAEGVRRGAAYLRSLRILPDSCEIDYELPPVPQVVMPDLPPVEEPPVVEESLPEGDEDFPEDEPSESLAEEGEGPAPVEPTVVRSSLAQDTPAEPDGARPNGTEELARPTGGDETVAPQSTVSLTEVETAGAETPAVPDIPVTQDEPWPYAGGEADGTEGLVREDLDVPLDEGQPPYQAADTDVSDAAEMPPYVEELPYGEEDATAAAESDWGDEGQVGWSDSEDLPAPASTDSWDEDQDAWDPMAAPEEEPAASEPWAAYEADPFADVPIADWEPVEDEPPTTPVPEADDTPAQPATQIEPPAQPATEAGAQLVGEDQTEAGPDGKEGASAPEAQTEPEPAPEEVVVAESLPENEQAAWAGEIPGKVPPAPEVDHREEALEAYAQASDLEPAASGNWAQRAWARVRSLFSRKDEQPEDNPQAGDGVLPGTETTLAEADDQYMDAPVLGEDLAEVGQAVGDQAAGGEGVAPEPEVPEGTITEGALSGEASVGEAAETLSAVTAALGPEARAAALSNLPEVPAIDEEPAVPAPTAEATGDTGQAQVWQTSAANVRVAHPATRRTVSSLEESLPQIGYEHARAERLRAAAANLPPVGDDNPFPLIGADYNEVEDKGDGEQEAPVTDTMPTAGEGAPAGVVVETPPVVGEPAEPEPDLVAELAPDDRHQEVPVPEAQIEAAPSEGQPAEAVPEGQASAPEAKPEPEIAEGAGDDYSAQLNAYFDSRPRFTPDPEEESAELWAQFQSFPYIEPPLPPEAPEPADVEASPEPVAAEAEEEGAIETSQVEAAEPLAEDAATVEAKVASPVEAEPEAEAKPAPEEPTAANLADTRRMRALTPEQVEAAREEAGDQSPAPEPATEAPAEGAQTPGSAPEEDAAPQPQEAAVPQEAPERQETLAEDEYPEAELTPEDEAALEAADAWLEEPSEPEAAQEPAPVAEESIPEEEGTEAQAPDVEEGAPEEPSPNEPEEAIEVAERLLQERRALPLYPDVEDAAWEPIEDDGTQDGNLEEPEIERTAARPPLGAAEPDEGEEAEQASAETELTAGQASQAATEDPGDQTPEESEVVASAQHAAEPILAEGYTLGEEKPQQIDWATMEPEPGMDVMVDETGAHGQTEATETPAGDTETPAGDTEPEPAQPTPGQGESDAAEGAEATQAFQVRGTFIEEEEPTEDELAQRDTGGLSLLSDDEATQPQPPLPRPRPRAVEDPSWGKSDFTPAVGNIARRATLFDLPDPSEAYVDPLATDPKARPLVVQAAPQEEGHASDDASSRSTNRPYERGDRQPISVISGSGLQPEAPQPTAYHPTADPQAGKRRKFHLFGHKDSEPEAEDSLSEWLGVDEDYDAKSGGREIGSWDNFRREEEDMGRRGRKWKGGATTRPDLRLVDDDQDQDVDGGYGPEGYTLGGYGDESAGQAAPGTDQEGSGYDFGVVPDLPYITNGPRDLDDRAREAHEDERAAITGMGDDELLSHDIWFVATGASGLDHAGARKFLEEHRKDIRGAFVINLDSVGAGELCALTSEGANPARKADRRMVRMLTTIAQDLHIPLGHARRDWEDTDATPLMQRSMRAVTLMGLDEDGQPALSHTADDQPEAVNDAQVVDVAELVAEFIRRS